MNSDVVKSSQPFFLIQLCLGTLIMASSIIPMSLQEPISERSLDMACMCSPWLLFNGYAIAFSALLSKSWRINTLIKYGKQFRRIKVSVTDAMFPLAVLIVCNISLLIVWTVMSPVTWERIEVANYDEFGRSVESYGRCEGDGSTTTKIIVYLMAIVNGLGLLFTNYQGFKTRALPTAFNESFYLAIANASLLEALILGIPILVLANDSPSTRYIVKAILVTLVCLCVLLPLFIPKHLQRGNESKRNYVKQSLHPTNHSSNLFQDTVTIAEDCLGTRIARHDYYYVQRKVPPPPGGGATGNFSLGATPGRVSDEVLESSAELPVP
jgi:gamma-aminobutyric acid type B receptor